MPKIIYDEWISNTDKAVMYSIGGEKHWIPKSQIEHEDIGNHILQLPKWLIDAQGLSGYVFSNEDK